MVSLRQPGADRLLKMGGVSLVIHIALAVFLNLNPWSTIIKVRPTAYTVTLMPVSIPEPEIQKAPIPPTPKEEKVKPVEKIKPAEKPKKEDIVEKVKKKEIDKESMKRLHETLEGIRKEVALDEIRKKVALREPVEEKTPVPPQSKGPLTSKYDLEKIYGDLIESKIKGAWTIPENLIKEMVDLETIIVLIITLDGTIQKVWFEKKSGNTLYDQSAMRAIKKAEPLPPIPKELGKNSLECVIRFTPD